MEIKEERESGGKEIKEERERRERGTKRENQQRGNLAAPPAELSQRR